jgi:type-F conjugative transfer system pilin assembly protein TrbC
VRFKLKTILALLINLAVSYQALANEDLNFATELQKNSTAMVWQNLKEIFTQTEQAQDSKNLQDTTLTKQESELYVFVSTSMPKPLLKAYAQEAKKYGGVLVFKGLPNGSFKELAVLVAELTIDPVGTKDANNSLGLQIDDEAFDRFDVSAVPTIILSTTSEYQPHQTSTVIYDKITGNVGIKYALEQFSSSGVLAIDAAERLNE